MGIQPILNVSSTTHNKKLYGANTDKQAIQPEQEKNNINLNNSPVGILNKNSISFKRNYRDYNYLFLNYDDVYNSKTEILPKWCYTGNADKSIYLSKASASAPLSQENLWKLLSPKEFENFLNENPDLSSILYNSPISKSYTERGVQIDLQKVRNILKNKEKNDWFMPVFDFAKAFEEKFNIDILKEPKYYRFIGKSELVKLLKGEEIEKQPPYYQKVLDITINPELNWNQFRVTYKTNEEFTNIDETDSMTGRVMEHDTDDYRYYLKKPYSLKDIEKLEMATPHGLLEFDLNHKYTNEELNAIDTLMFCD